MSNKNKPGMGFEVNIRSPEAEKAKPTIDSNTPFCMAIMGDFSGDHGAQNKPLSARKPVAIDRDNFDEVLSKFQVSFDICLDEDTQSRITIDIHELDDFHPDALYEKLEIFSRLRSIRRRLKKKDSFDAAASEIMGWLVAADSADIDNEQKKPDAAPVQEINQDNLLNNILDSTRQPSSDIEKAAGPAAIDQLVKNIIAPYVEPSADPRQQEMLAAVDLATAEHMRQILHHPRFQAMEAAWRSIYFLIKRIETGRDIKIYLLDISKQELQTELSAQPSGSRLHKLFCDPAPGDTYWSLLVGNYFFEDTIDDALLLAQVGTVAQQAGAPFIAGARETLAGCESFSDYPDADDWSYKMKPGAENAWTLLRQDAVAEYIGLALPRFLLRAPYGSKSSPIGSFEFEEMPEHDCHECFLWGNAAFIKAEQLARAFEQDRWEMHPAEAHQTDRLPMYYYNDQGEMVLMPCAEIYLTEKGGHKLSAKGLVPVWSVKNMDAVRSSDFSSLTAHSKLRGRWTG